MVVDFERAVSVLPQVEPFPGLTAAWRWYRAPRWYGALAVSPEGGHAFEVRGLDSFDEGLIRSVLFFARGREGSGDGPLSVVAGFHHEPFGFDAVAACTPGVHRYHLGEDDELHAVVTGVFPAFACEFSGTETLDEARYRFRHMLRPTILTRSPVPYVKMRFGNTSTGGGSVGQDRGFTTADVLRRELHLLGSDAPGSFVELENVRGEVRRVEWLNGTWAVTGASLETLRRGQLDAWIDETLAGAPG